MLTSHERAAVTQACRKIAGIADEDDAGSVIKEMGESRMARDEDDVWINAG